MSHILERINSPADLTQLTIGEMEQLAVELRRLIVDTVAENGGHLASSLGAIELTLALYKVFRPPQDKVVWDVGHQAYAHKILTGRRDRFSTLRRKGGITGFPRRAESIYDIFGVGHASTSVSAALGLAAARDISGRGEHVIAVIGDGAMTGGEVFEALNHAGDLKKNLIVILNDNGLSIDGHSGALSDYLSCLRITPEYIRAKHEIEGLIKHIPHIGETVYKTASLIKESVKSAIVPGGLFEELGFRYAGPVDGHNLKLLTEVFTEVSQLDGPILVHVRTKKGKGYMPAEMEPEKFHGVGPFDVISGQIKKKAAPPSYTQVFSDTLRELARENRDIVAITAAMPSGTGLKAFAEEFPDRFFDVGIAEEHAVTMAGGMAAGGVRPVVAIYSTFMQRSYDQIFHDICLQNVPVLLCLDRAGLVGEDGATHHGVFDLSYLRSLPNMTIMAPKDENELRQMLAAAFTYNRPVAIRYPRGAGLGVEIRKELRPVEYGRGERIEIPEVNAAAAPITILAVGSQVDNARQAAIQLKDMGIDVAVVNMRFIKPLDLDLITGVVNNPATKLIVTAEENVLAGGFGSGVLEAIADLGAAVPVLRFGIGDEFVPNGTQREEREYCGLLPEQMAEKISDRYKKAVEKQL